MSSVRIVLKRIAYAGIFFVSGMLALSWPTTADANGGKGGGRSGASSRRATRTQSSKRAAPRTRSRGSSRSSAARAANRAPRSRPTTAARSRATKAAPQAASRNNRPAASDTALARPGADGIARLSDGSWLGSSPNSRPASPGTNRPTASTNRPTPSINRTPNINPATPNKPGTGVTRLADGSLRFPLYYGRPGGAQSLQGMVRIEPPSDSGAPRRWSYRSTTGKRNRGYLQQPTGPNIGPGLFFEGDSTSMDDLVGTADIDSLGSMDQGNPGRIQFRSGLPSSRRWYGGSMGLGANRD